ncbi:MAG: N-acetyltransferase [Bacillota bacterium]|nr:MAG: N-acetyltransferase [Bacillota bacterium]
MEIRPMMREDYPAVQALYRELFFEMAAIAPMYIQAADQDVEYLDAVLDSDEDDVLVADEEGTILGFVVLQTQLTPPIPCMVRYRFAALMDLMVRPDARNKGIGTALIDAAKAWTRQNGLRFLELDVLLGNQRARSLYEREGFAPVLSTMRLMMEEKP